MRYPLKSASSFPLCHCERPSCLHPLQVFATQIAVRIQLPKLNLPTFSDKYDEWFPFFDTFNSVIHFNTSLSNTQRFQYLWASLTGDANAVISSLSDANYDVASILRDRYNNKRVIKFTSRL